MTHGHARNMFKEIIGFLLFTTVATGLFAEAGGVSRSFIIDLENLELARTLWKQGDPGQKKSVRTLRMRAMEALKAGPFSITGKKHLPPGNDPHDFLSYGAYYWPNPDTEDGRPWIMKDCYINPESAVDWPAIKAMALETETLALAYFFTGQERFATHAALLLRVFFIDKKTRMNPHMNYSKIIPGKREGGYSVAGFGYVSRKIYDAAGILESSKSWTSADKKAFQDWTRDFIHWTETSPYGREERASRNNHSTFFTMTAMLQSLYIGDKARARAIFQYYIKKQFPRQFAPDGTQPFEMKRPNNFDYHRTNLMIAFDIAQLARHIGHNDVWHYKSAKSGSLRNAIDFLVPYLSREKEWKRFPKKPFKVTDQNRWGLLRRAAVVLGDPALAKAADSLNNKTDWHFISLKYPAAAVKGLNGTKEKKDNDATNPPGKP